MDFTLFPANPSFYAEYEIRDKKTGYLYTDKLNIRILDLTEIEDAEQAGKYNPKLIKWAKIFQAKTMGELEQIAGDEEVFKSMVSHIKVLTEDEKVRQQCAAREDYERRMIGEYKRGARDGEAIGLQKGEQKYLINQVKKKIQKQKSLDQIVAEVEEEKSVIEPIYNLIKDNPDKTADELVEMLNGPEE